MTETKEKILDSAERLFAENGFAATSVRHIIADAGVNLASIHYHFGTKEDVLDEVILRRIRAVNEVRTARLEKLEAEAAGEPLALDRILGAFIAPAGDVARKHPHWVRIMGRMHAEGFMPGFAKRHPLPAFERFLNAIRRAVPHLGEEEFRWRTLLMFGAMAHAMAWAQTVTLEPTADTGGHVAALVSFLSGGWQAPAKLPKEATATR